MTRKELETLAWKNTHRDFRGTQVRKYGRRVLYLNPAGGGTELWPLSALPESELRRKARLPEKKS